MIYLDYNATTPMWPEVQAALMKAAAQPGNPSSVHSAGRAARAIVEHARDGLAHAMGVRARDLVFTSGGTEANALALRMAGEMPVLISAIEHESVLGQAAGATQVPVLADGTLDLAALEALIAGRAVFLSLMAANNETGVVQPVAAAAALVHQFGGLVHCDAVQLLGKAEFAAGISTADFISVSAHKIGGPQGVGALAVTCGLAPQPMLRGGGQEQGWRAGTENVAGIAGFGAAVIEICRADWWVQCAALRDALEAALPDAARILSPSVARLPNTSNLWMAGVPAATQVMMLDLEGIAVSAGAACSSGKVKSSHVLRAMGLPENIAAQTIRVSLGWNTTAQEIEHFCAVWKKMAARAVATRSAA
jgi:cysteine desulfurase